MNTVIVGVTGSVAAYKSADIVRELMRSGFSVRVCLTRAAEEFVTPTLFEALTGNPCLTHVFDEPVPGRMAHIDWARDASAILICPATANAVAQIANGQAADMLGSILVATDAPVVIAPAMNPQMYASESVQLNLRTLRARGCEVVEPTVGDVACGEFGQGRLASVDRVVSAVASAAYRSQLFAKVSVLVTAGPTHEPVDAVRYLANRSSGKMGYAVAKMLLQMGADVTLVSGPTGLTPPPAAKTIKVQTAEEMLAACKEVAGGCSLAVCAAAVGDFRAKDVHTSKLKNKSGVIVELAPNPDVIQGIREANPAIRVVGFAAETDCHVDNAQSKLREKGLFAIALNRVDDPTIGFDSDENELTLFFAAGSSKQIDRSSKLNVARVLLEAVHKRIPG